MAENKDKPFVGKYISLLQLTFTVNHNVLSSVAYISVIRFRL